MNIEYINRKTGLKEKEIVAGERLLKWSYESTIGKALLETIIKKKIASRLYGRFQDRNSSKKKIKAFIEEFNIDMKEVLIENPDDYRTFNDFFIRKLKPEARKINFDSKVLISPADGKILCYENIDTESLFQIKDSVFSLKSLLNDKSKADEYEKGTLMIIRLAPSDYHRFHFIDDCNISSYKKIEGCLYSVNPIALKATPNIYCENKRDITVLDTENFNEVLMIEVGATFVGTIVQTFKESFSYKRGEEKGFFKFGGSTVILLFKKDAVKIDDDILKNTALGLETKVELGEKIAKKIES